MKKRLYWRPRSVSRTTVLMAALFSLVGLVAVENLRTRVQQPYYEEKREAAALAEKCIDALKTERLERGIEIDYELDPIESGMIGGLMTSTTTVSGTLLSKQLSTNPNFAAVVVDMLKRAGVRRGELVAVGCSGSFPALNVSVYAALETLGLTPIVISSAGASQFGANYPQFLWMDMEHTLHRQKFIQFRSVACSIGGYEDLGLGMSDEARNLVQEAIKRNGLPLLESSDFASAIQERMHTYREHAKGRPIRVYINVGGGTVSVGRSIGKRLYRPGLNLRPPRGSAQIDSVMTRFINEGTPVVHFVQIQDLAERYGLPVQLEVPPVIGEGNVFVQEQYNRWLAGGILAVILFGLRAFVLTDVGFRLFQIRIGKRTEGHPEQMV